MQEEAQTTPLETALAHTQQDAEAALAMAEKVVSALKTLQKATRQGDMRRLRALPEAIQTSVASLDTAVGRLATDWAFDAEAYLRDGGYFQEVLNVARAQGFGVSLQDDRLYSYPVLVSTVPSEGAVKIEKKLERVLRPSALIALLRERRERPPRFKAGPFLESLRKAYDIALERQARTRHFGSVVPLRELYDLLTLFPGLGRDYSLPEFTRDIYLLDTTGDLRTRDGATAEFHASTGTKSARSVLSLITEAGSEKRYYGMAFSKGG